jgi:O-antigen ligase
MTKAIDTLARWWTWHVPLSTGILLVTVFGLAPLFGWALAGEQWILLAVVVLVSLIPVIIRWPVVSTFGLYALLACSFDVVPLLEGSTLTKPIGVLAGAVLASAALVERRLGRPPSAALWWGLFVLWAALSAGWALDAGVALARLRILLSFFFLYLVTVAFRPSRKEFYWVCALTVLGGVMAAGWGYLFGLSEEATGNAARARIVIGDQGSNPNHLGRTLILPLALAIAGYVGMRGVIQRAMAVGCVGLIGVGIYISMSRAALAAMIVMISVLWYRMRARWQILVAAVILLAFSMMMPDQFYRRVGSTVTGEDSTGAGRTEIWKVGFEALERFGILGAGLDNFTEVHSLKVASAGGGRGAHNMYLSVWVELGGIGLGLMLAALGSHFLAVWRARKAGHGSVVLAALEAACLGVLVLAIFGDSMWSKSFWLAWTLLTWAVYCEEQSDQAPDAPEQR